MSTLKKHGYFIFHCWALFVMTIDGFVAIHEFGVGNVNGGLKALAGLFTLSIPYCSSLIFFTFLIQRRDYDERYKT